MKLKEFINELSKLAQNEQWVWSMFRGQVIGTRSGIAECVYCPITAIEVEKTCKFYPVNEYINVGRHLGFSINKSFAIAGAADVECKRLISSRKIRHRVLRTAILTALKLN